VYSAPPYRTCGFAFTPGPVGLRSHHDQAYLHTCVAHQLLRTLPDQPDNLADLNLADLNLADPTSYPLAFPTIITLRQPSDCTELHSCARRIPWCHRLFPRYQISSTKSTLPILLCTLSIASQACTEYYLLSGPPLALASYHLLFPFFSLHLFLPLPTLFTHPRRTTLPNLRTFSLISPLVLHHSSHRPPPGKVSVLIKISDPPTANRRLLARPQTRQSQTSRCSVFRFSSSPC